MKKFGGYQLIIGFLLGAAVFGGSSALAAGIIAEPKTATIVVDGITVDLKGYLIEGAHYFQLRDLSEKLKPGGKDFSIVWDSAENRVIIDTARGYDKNEVMPLPAKAASSPESEATQNIAQGMTITEMKMELIRLTNQERAKSGTPELEVLSELMGTAQAKADDMKANHYYGHNSPVYGSPGEMMKAAIPAIKSCAENIAPWRKTPEEVFIALSNSQEHRKNMLNQKYTHIGVGIIPGADGGFWWVQQFVTL